ncbi:MAG: His-Xaa-Ser system radical SAM maturase HxsB [Proteobacteria bacterium]|nr:His-Xaa-Ser system radical SAM maturase HxsB [Pseudomonadota bacterium]MCP4918815.1 His-Xaa-Ser system radical SAM maturase HxsB [Pseudomonadota bacterium]
MTRTLTIDEPAGPIDHVGFFRWDQIGDKVVMTNDAGEWQLLERDEFDAFLANTVEDGALKTALVDKGFLRDGSDLNGLADRIRRKKRWLDQGPHLHGVVTTLRCNQSCAYCHASRTDMDRVDTDMSIETAKKVVDLAMQSPSPAIGFEFQGGEPTIRFDIMQFIYEYSIEKNRYENKELFHAVVTNMTYMTEEMGHWLIDNGVLVCTSLDGPQEVHDQNRAWRGGTGAHATVIKWIKWFNEQYVARGMDPELFHVDALMTTTQAGLSKGRELVDLYVDLGIRNVHLRPLNPFGFAAKTWKAIGYTMDEFMEFYSDTLGYILELNRQGVQIQEGHAAIFLQKLLTPDDPNFVDIRSPIGSGTGQLSYGYDGRLYPSDEGRMVAAAGDEFFQIGHVDSSTWDEVYSHPTVKALATSSLLDTLPGCSTCFNAPFCGARPMHNYMDNGDLFGQRPNTPKCQQHMDTVKLLLNELAQDSDGSTEAIFRRWTITRARAAEEA